MSRSLRVTGGVIALGLALFAGGALIPRNEAPRAISALAGAPTTADVRIDTQDVDAAIASLDRRIDEGGPRVAADQAALALAFLQKARVEAEPTLYSDADDALAASFRIQPNDNAEATLGAAILAGSRHDFHGQLRWARRAVAINPYDAEAHGIAGDAYIELGRTERGLESYQRMVDIRPDLSSLGRISYAADVQGNTPGAIEAMERALTFAGSSRESAAWSHWQLGELYIGANQLGRAEDHLRTALSLVPAYGSAIESTAHLAAARGDIDGAIEILSGLAEDVPLPGNYAFLGELHLIEGNKVAASAAFAEADRLLSVYGEHGVRPDVDFVAFWADRGIDVERALRVAHRLYGERKSAAVSDALGWALYVNGRFTEARSYAREALRRGPGDSGYLYHLGMIVRALGDRDRSDVLLTRALRLDPSWSIIESHHARGLLRR